MDKMLFLIENVRSRIDLQTQHLILGCVFSAVFTHFSVSIGWCEFWENGARDLDAV